MEILIVYVHVQDYKDNVNDSYKRESVYTHPYGLCNNKLEINSERILVIMQLVKSCNTPHFLSRQKYIITYSLSPGDSLLT